MTKFIYSDFIPEAVKFFTAGSRYEIIEKTSDYKDGTEYQVFVYDDNDVKRGPINVGKPCDYIDERLWSVEGQDDDETPAV